MLKGKAYYIDGRAGGRGGSCPPLADKGASGIKCPCPQFRRHNGMMPANTEII